MLRVTLGSHSVMSLGESGCDATVTDDVTVSSCSHVKQRGV